jgi:hypothetical protein
MLTAQDIMFAFHALKNKRDAATLKGLECCKVFLPIEKVELNIHVPGKIKISRIGDFKVNYLGTTPYEICLQEQSGYGPRYSCSLNLTAQDDF